MAALKPGDVLVAVVTKVTSGLIVVTVQGMRGIIPGSVGTGVKVGDRLKIRVVDLKSDGKEFIAARLGVA